MKIDNNKAESTTSVEQRHTRHTDRPSLEFDNVIPFPSGQTPQSQGKEKQHGAFGLWLKRALGRAKGILQHFTRGTTPVSGRRKGGAPAAPPARRPKEHQVSGRYGDGSNTRKRMSA